MGVKVQPKKIETVAPESVPEVRAFLEAQAALEAFKKENASVFTIYEGLVDAFNTSLENADKTLRARCVGSGPFDLYAIKKAYDAKKLYDELGEETFLQVGGSTRNEVVYTVNVPLLEAMIERGDVPEEVVNAVLTNTPNYHKPKKIVL